MGLILSFPLSKYTTWSDISGVAGMVYLTLGSFVFFTALVGLLTWLITRGAPHDNSDGYFLAGRTLTGGFIAGSLMLTNLSTEQLVGLNGAAFKDGICVMAWEVIAAASLVVMALVFLPKYLRSGITTVPQFLEQRFDSGTRSITSLIFIVAYAGILLPIILYTGATGMAGILDMENLVGINYTTLIWILVWMIGVIGSIYAIFGGLRTVAVSDTLNGFGLLVGGIMISYFGLRAVNGEGILAGLQQLQTEHPEKFNSIGGSGSSVPFGTLFTGVLLLNLFYWTTNQQIIQRTLGASSLKEGQKGVLMAGALKVLAPIILVIPGILAFHFYGQIKSGAERLVIKDVVTDEVALVLTEIGDTEAAAGGTAVEVIKHGASAMELIGSQPIEAMAGQTIPAQGNQPAYRVERVLNKNDIVAVDSSGQNAVLSDQPTQNFVSWRTRDKAYGQLVQQVLPPWLAGFFAAVILGAILSSFNSALNSTATLFSLGVFRHLLHKNATDQQVIRAGKVFGTLIALASMTVAPFLLGQDSIFGYLQKMNGLYFIPIFSVVLVGLIARRVPAMAAKLGLVLGFAAIALGYFVFPNAVDKVHEFHFLGIVFASLIGIMLLIGAIKPREAPWVQEHSGDVDLTPWRLAWPMGIGLIVFVLVVYVYFADTSVLGNDATPQLGAL